MAKIIFNGYKVASRMQNLIQDLLTYSRTNISERKFEKIDLITIIDEVIAEFKETIQEKQAVIDVTEICPALIIPFQFRQLLFNLISNSLKFSNKSIPPHITISCKIENGMKINNDKLNKEINYCHIIFQDNGIGFEPEYNKRIFDVFQRLHGKDEYPGTGIGLAIVKKIVDYHHGIIIATGILNKGAIFDIYIPA
jgi:signal transduction histidine kinase